MAEKNVVKLLAEKDAWKAQGAWTPACGGTEVPFTTRTGRRLLYCWQQRSGRHAYLDLGSDIILTDDEARAALSV